MKIVAFETDFDRKLGILTDDGVVDFSDAFQVYALIQDEEFDYWIEDMLTFLQTDYLTTDIFAEVLDFIHVHNLMDRFLIAGEVRLLPPIARPPKIIALGLNYASHAQEAGRESPKEPVIFCKASTAVIGPEEDIVISPKFGRVDPEVELAVIIGKTAKDVSREEAHEYIAGYTIVNDVSARAMQSADFELRNPWFRSKSIDTFCPMGPCMVLPDEISPLDELDLELKVNGETRQKSNTRQLIFKIPELIEYISSLMTLEPGDVISTGTPEGIAPIEPGDVVEASVERIGVLRNYVESA